MTWPFGLTNAPITFIRLMNHVLRELLRKSAVYFDLFKDFVRTILITLKKERLYANLNKCFA